VDGEAIDADIDAPSILAAPYSLSCAIDRQLFITRLDLRGRQ
jgi:hypothetical protein